MSGLTSILVSVGKGAGVVVGTLYQSGRQSVDQVIRNILPFMCFIAFVIGLITYTGVGTAIANSIGGLANSLPGLVLLGVIGGIPILSPLLGPGAVMAQIIGTTLIGNTLIASGAMAPQLALPALFAINSQVGCDFIPVGLALGEAEPETVEIGVPAVLFSRQITGPLAVVIAYLASFGLYA